jgi:hypothetical protein
MSSQRHDPILQNVFNGSACKVEEKESQSAKAAGIATVFFLFIDIISLSKALKVPCHLLRKRQEPCVEAFDLTCRGPIVLGKVEDVHFAMAVANPHTNRRVTQGIQRMNIACEQIYLKL